MGRTELAERRLRDAVVRTRLTLATNPPVLDRERALSRAASADRILFVCLGNICRSPMAERYARGLLTQARTDVEVDSAGFIEREGRRSPENAVTAAAEYGVDLTEHRSTLLTSQAIDASDVVFVMDVRNYRDLKRTFRPVDAEVYFLGPLAGTDGHFEIPDPEGSGPEAFADAYDDVTSAVNTLIATISSGTADRPREFGSHNAV